MALEEPPCKKQALDTGQGFGQNNSTSQDADKSLERSLLGSVTNIHQKLELCLSQNCLCSVEDDEVGFETFSVVQAIFAPGSNLHIALPNPVTNQHSWFFSRAKHSR